MSRRRSRILVVSGGRTEQRYLAGLRRAHPDSDSFDDIWCVVDVDQFDVRQAVLAAAQAGVGIAVSNPCFELWLLLHFEDCAGHLDGYREAARRLGRHLPGYAKSRLDYADYSGGLSDALARARRLGSRGDDVCPNPSTGVWQLVERMTES
jgi:hypothetical protein